MSPQSAPDPSQRIGRVKLEIHVRLEPKFAAALQDALYPEVRQAPEQYINAELRRKGGHLVITLSGREISHVRASMNSFLRLISAAVYSVIAISG